MNWLAVAVGVGLVAAAINTVGILLSAVTDRQYFPPGERDWRFYLHWTCSHVLNLAIIAVAVLDWNGLGLARPATLAVGAALFVGGYAVAIKGGRDLGLGETMGLTGELQVAGLYRYSRHPQYVGYLVATVGAALLIASPWALVLLGLYATWWLTLPFAEEPWLRAQYGAAYERYRSQVPRFVGRRSLSPYTADSPGYSASESDRRPSP
jgi:protein-S-isoprenylcysteine O-methyltransferase Ste14